VSNPAVTTLRFDSPLSKAFVTGGAISLKVLEHIEGDDRALSRLFWILQPSGSALITF